MNERGGCEPHFRIIHWSILARFTSKICEWKLLRVFSTWFFENTIERSPPCERTHLFLQNCQVCLTCFDTHATCSPIKDVKCESFHVGSMTTMAACGEVTERDPSPQQCSDPSSCSSPFTWKMLVGQIELIFCLFALLFCPKTNTLFVYFVFENGGCLPEEIDEKRAGVGW